MQCGGQENSTYSRLFCLVLRYILGNALGTLENDFQLHSKLVKAMKLSIQMIMPNCCHQTVLKLMGLLQADSVEHKGEVISEEIYRCYSQDFTMWPTGIMGGGVLITYSAIIFGMPT